MEKPYRIVIADHHVPFRSSLKSFFWEKADWHVVGEAGNSRELLDLLRGLSGNNLTPHLVILDMSMPVLKGIEATRQIKMSYPDTGVLVLSMQDSGEYVNHVLSAGAGGYLLKKDTAAEIFTAIESIRQGGVYVSPILSSKIENGFG